MRALLRTLTQLSINADSKPIQVHNLSRFLAFQKPYSTQDGNGNKEPDWAAHFGAADSTGNDPLGWDAGASSWSTGLTKEHFDGEVIGQQVSSEPGQSQRGAGGSGESPRGRGYSDARWTDQEMTKMRELEAANRRAKAFVDTWDDKMNEITVIYK
ncbi:hypothetical protein CDL12_30014 [Handroanthus impetiginosus]|uniref:Uncharacterized protein n=1 Tax=Handroanthus impetiginosus TaxID=429701 RepID=A0A2G9FWT0_9LAMI|nr:hypothetical protein CDL12_30014 [Handroanthus impetiginosus]